MKLKLSHYFSKHTYNLKSFQKKEKESWKITYCGNFLPNERQNCLWKCCANDWKSNFEPRLLILSLIAAVNYRCTKRNIASYIRICICRGRTLWYDIQICCSLHAPKFHLQDGTHLSFMEMIPSFCIMPFLHFGFENGVSLQPNSVGLPFLGFQ